MVLLHVDHKGKHPHVQRLQVRCGRNRTFDLKYADFMVFLMPSNVFFSSAFQDQRLVGVSPLRVHLFVRRHAYLVRSCFGFYAVISYWNILRDKYRQRCHFIFMNLVFFHRPEGPMYQMFRSQFLAFSIYQSKSYECVYFKQRYIFIASLCMNRMCLRFETQGLMLILFILDLRFSGISFDGAVSQIE